MLLCPPPLPPIANPTRSSSFTERKRLPQDPWPPSAVCGAAPHRGTPRYDAHGSGLSCGRTMCSSSLPRRPQWRCQHPRRCVKQHSRQGETTTSGQGNHHRVCFGHCIYRMPSTEVAPASASRVSSMVCCIWPADPSTNAPALVGTNTRASAHVLVLAGANRVNTTWTRGRVGQCCKIKKHCVYREGQAYFDVRSALVFTCVGDSW